MSLKNLLQNFRRHMIDVNGISSYKQEQAFKLFIAKLWALMSHKSQEDYFFTLINIVKNSNENNKQKDIDITLKILIDIWSNMAPSSGKTEASVIDAISNEWINELHIAHTFVIEQISELLQAMFAHENKIVVLTNATEIIIVMKKNENFMLYNPVNIDNSYICNSSINAANIIFDMLNKYMDQSNNRIGLCCSLYRIEE